MFTKQQEELMTKMFRLLKPVKMVSEELIRSGVARQNELDVALAGVKTAHDCLEKHVGKGKTKQDSGLRKVKPQLFQTDPLHLMLS